MENSILLDYKSVLENNKTSLVNAIHEYNSEDIKLNNYISEIESIYSNKLKVASILWKEVILWFTAFIMLVKAVL